jgi:glycine betaine catabolism A
MAREIHYTLPGHDYHAAEVFDEERARIFHRVWTYAGRADQVAEPGACLALDVAGESVLVVRGRDGGLHGHFNVCRHRGSRLCDEGLHQLKGAIKCPYHAWSYSHDGRLVGTPNVAADELDRDELSLWPISVEAWEGFLFVSLDPAPEPLRDWLARNGDTPLGFERFGLGSLRTAHTTVVDVPANWKIIIENYNECLHCPTVHPELVAIVPTYRSGSVTDESRDDGGVALGEGMTTFSHTGRSALPLLQGMDPVAANSYFGCVVFPNMFIDVTGTSAIATMLQARGPAHTRVVTEYLFTEYAISAPDFDPGEIVAFSELVAAQDYAVCERVQQGVSSKAFTHGILAAKDDLLHWFNERYLAERQGTTSHRGFTPEA